MVSEKDRESAAYDVFTYAKVRVADAIVSVSELRKTDSVRSLETAVITPLAWIGSLGYFAGALAVESTKPIAKRIKTGVSRLASNVIAKTFDDSDEAHAHIESGFGDVDLDAGDGDFKEKWTDTDHAILAGDCGAPIKNEPFVPDNQLPQQQFDAHPGYDFRPSRGPSAHDGGRGLA